MAAQGIRPTKSRDGRYDTVKVAGNTKIYGGTIVVLEGGYAKPGRSAAGLVALGRATESVDNTGGQNGDKTIVVERSELDVDFLYGNDTTKPVSQADVGKDCFILDDETVTGDGTDRSAAGKVVEVVSSGVWIRFPS
jgi:hypothetical protein